MLVRVSYRSDRMNLIVPTYLSSAGAALCRDLPLLPHLPRSFFLGRCSTRAQPPSFSPAPTASAAAVGQRRLCCCPISPALAVGQRRPLSQSSSPPSSAAVFLLRPLLHPRTAPFFFPCSCRRPVPPQPQPPPTQAVATSAAGQRRCRCFPAASFALLLPPTPSSSPSAHNSAASASCCRSASVPLSLLPQSPPAVPSSSSSLCSHLIGTHPSPDPAACRAPTSSSSPDPFLPYVANSCF
ncbi:hypothetical protein BHE74_00033629 [Ensete ventricosum]|nr:hypothetical protein BHE74_00033629 [Ensete ventricosum]